MRYLPIIYLIFFSNICWGQSITLNSSLQKDLSITSDESITLKPGFTTNGYNFQAKIISNTLGSSATNLATNKKFVLKLKPTVPIKSINSDYVLKNYDCNKYISQIDYFNGLGQIEQSSIIGGSPTGKDIIQTFFYDSKGRQNKKYLPYTASTKTGEFFSDNISKTEQFYNTLENETHPYSEVVYDDSPLSEPIEITSPGTAWAKGNGHTQKISHYITTGEEEQVLEWHLVSANPYWSYKNFTAHEDKYYDRDPVYWESKKFFVEEKINEDGVRNKIYKNGKGQIILQRNISTVGSSSIPQFIDTYYIYDEKGNLSIVLPPNVSNKIKTNNLHDLTSVKNEVYIMTYDERNNLIHRKQPDKDWEEFVYSNSNLLLTYRHDVDNTVQFYKYDRLGRMVYSGTTGVDQDPYQAADYGESFEERGNEIVGYTCASFPFNRNELDVLEVNYYDDYDFPNVNTTELNKDVFGVKISKSVSGLLTGKSEKVHSTNKWIHTNFYYDKKGRLIKTIRCNQLDGYDITSLQLDFNGNIIKKEIKHLRSPGEQLITTLEEYEYDHMMRLTQITHSINGKNKERIANYKYNSIGQLTQKDVGGRVNSNALQHINLDYNIRGWLTSVNNAELSASDNDLFGFEIKYNTPEASNLGSTNFYDGNISEFQWISANDKKKRTYSYQYDGMRRMTKATFGAGNTYSQDLNKYSLENVEYDSNGNITKLKRRGLSNNIPGVIDDLEYSYSGNKINYILDKAPNSHKSEGYCNLSGTGESYFYDKRGRLLEHTNHHERYYYYNNLGLIQSVMSETNDNYINGVYTYSGLNNLIKKYFDIDGDVQKTEYFTNTVYYNDKLQYIRFAEGYIIPLDGAYKYVYHYKDHLGNIRMNYSDLNADGKVDKSEILEENNYYPFGLRHKGYNNLVRNYFKSKFNGCELENNPGLNYYEMTHRIYFPEIGRWNRMDPVVQFSYSPYSAFNNNPLFYSDPLGLDNEPILIGEVNVYGVNQSHDRTPQFGEIEQIDPYDYYGDDLIGNYGDDYLGNFDFIYDIEPLEYADRTYYRDRDALNSEINMLKKYFNPNIEEKLTTSHLLNKFLTIESYTKNTIHKSKSNFTIVTDQKGINLGLDKKTFLGKVSAGMDQSISYGNNNISIGTSKNGNLIIDFSHSIGGNRNVGITITYHGEQMIRNLHAIYNYMEEGILHPNFHPSHPIAAPIPWPSVLYSF